MKKILRALTLIFICTVFALSSFLAEQEKTTDNVIQKQWENSLHARSLDTPEEKERMNQPGCAHCHTAQGYWREILAGKKSQAPYENATGITCEACHDVEKMSASDLALRAGNPEKACTGCHDILVQNDDKGFSSCLQGTILRGEGGAEFAGTAYRTATHSQVKDSCVGCHMADADQKDLQYQVGGHVFRVITKGHEPRDFNDTGCMECHVTITLAGIDKSQAEVKELMQELKDLLPKQKDGEPKFPEDPSLNKIQAKATFNYHYILKDGTWGIHNPIYIRQLLQSSLEALETTALTRDTGEAEIKLALVGQSLIKADPRKHWSNPFGSVRKIVESADVGFTNFEMAVDNNCGVPDNYQVLTGRPALEDDRPGNTSGPHAVHENIMDFLSSMNFKLQSLANNHAWDLGDCGIITTIAAAKKYGIFHAGAGLYIAHGDRIFDGVEIYKGRPIFRQFGGFSYQGLQDQGAYDPMVWEGLLGMLTIKDGYINSIEIFPLELDEGVQKEYGDAIEFREKRGFSEVAAGPMSTKILIRFKEFSTKYGTNVKIEGGKAIIDIHK